MAEGRSRSSKEPILEAVPGDYAWIRFQSFSLRIARCCNQVRMVSKIGRELKCTRGACPCSELAEGEEKLKYLPLSVGYDMSRDSEALSSSQAAI